MRSLIKSPGFAVYAILSLALGIGANTALFSVFDQLILKPLPVVDPSRLVVFHSEGANSGGISKDNYESVFSYPMFSDLSAQLTAPGGTFDVLFARSSAAVSVAGQGDPRIVRAELVSGTFFDALGLRPAAGRLFNTADDQKEGAHPVVVLSHAFWQEHLGSRRDIVGQTLRVNDQPMEIVGIAPSGFDGVVSGNKCDVYLTLHMKHVANPTTDNFNSRRSGWINVFGRLRPNITPTQAEAQAAPPYRAILLEELNTIKNTSEKFRTNFPAKKLGFVPAGQGINVMRKRYETELGFLMGMVGLILLIAGANVANLFTVRAIGRRREMAIRVSMGATRWDIIRQLLAESLILSLLGGLVATALGYWLEVGLSHYVEGIHPGLDWRALAFNFALALATALLFGLVPALQASNPELAGTLKDEGGAVSATAAQGRLRQVLALAQLALALTLLTAAGLFARSLGNLRNVDVGFNSENTVTFSLSPMLIGYTPERAQHLFEEVQTRIEALPGVQRAAAVAALPLAGSNSMTNVTIEGYTAGPDESLDVHFNAVSPGYFEALGVRRIAGREFERRDAKEAPRVAIVSQAFVQKWMKNSDPLGRHFGLGGGASTKLDMEIVGVIADQKTDDPRTDPYPFFYTPTAQSGPHQSLDFVVRATGDEKSISNAVRQAVHQIDANLPLDNLKSMKQLKDATIGNDTLESLLTGAFGILATILAALGLYGVLAFAVAQRTKEIGIRMALGATEGSVVKLVMKGMVRVMVAGVAIGLVGAYATGRWAESLLFGLKGFDPLVISGAVLLLAVVAVAAAALPALKASRTDPVTALRR